MQRGKLLSEEDLQIAEERRKAKGRGEKERYTYLFKKIRYQGNISCKDGLDKGQKLYGPNRIRRY